MRSINFRRVSPFQTVSDDVDDAAYYTPIIDTESSMRSREVKFDALKLGFGKPIVIRHRQVLLST